MSCSNFKLVSRMLFMLSTIPFFYSATSLADTKSGDGELRERFLASFQQHEHLSVLLLSPESRLREQATDAMLVSKAYKDHVGIYLTYYRSLNGEQDIFRGLITTKDIFRLEQATHAEFSRLLATMFGEGKLLARDFFHFFMNPERYLLPSQRQKLALRPGLTFHDAFNELKMALPDSYPYSSVLVLDPDVSGGYYAKKENKIVMGKGLEVNVSTLAGLIHEFGHSIYENPDVTNYDSSAQPPSTNVIQRGFNEGYAETWALQLPKFPFFGDLFSQASDPEAVEAFLTFRALLSLRFHLYALLLDRLLLAPSVDTEEYFALQSQYAKKFLLLSDMTPVLPILPYAKTPGYLPSYLLINILDEARPSTPVGSDSIKHLIQYAETVRGDSSEDHWISLLEAYCTEFLSANFNPPELQSSRR